MGFGLFELFIGYKVLDSLEKASESRIEFEKGKTKLMLDVKKFYTDNKEFFGPDYVTLIYEELDLIKSMNTMNRTVIIDDVRDFLNEMEFHLIATSGFKGILETLRTMPKDKLKSGFLEACLEKNDRLKNSYYPKETMEYWEDLMDFLYQNNVHIENRDDVRKQLKSKINS